MGRFFTLKDNVLNSFIYYENNRRKEETPEVEFKKVDSPEALKSSLQGHWQDKRDAIAFPKKMPKAVFFDLDSTVIHEETIDELAALTGVGEAVKKITEQAMAGELNFNQALNERVSLLRGASSDVWPQVCQRVHLRTGIEAFVGALKQQNIPSFLISGGFMPVAEYIAKKVGFADYFANSIATEDDKLLGVVEGQVVDREFKKTWMQNKCAEIDIDPLEVLVVGDGANDLSMMQAAGLAVGFEPKTILWPHLQGAIWSGDHRFLLPLFEKASFDIK